MFRGLEESGDRQDEHDEPNEQNCDPLNHLCFCLTTRLLSVVTRCLLFVSESYEENACMYEIEGTYTVCSVDDLFWFGFWSFGSITIRLFIEVAFFY